jgi:hypothetical protein
VFATVTLPLLRPAIANAVLLGFVESLGDFGNPLVLGGEFEVLATRIFFAIAGARHEPGRAAALAILLLGLTLAAFWLQERWKVYIGKKVSPVKWLGETEARGEKPHRVLVWAKPHEKDFPLPAECLHPDIVHEYAVGKEVGDLEAIDGSKPLPIDYILTFSKNPGLRAKARELGIRVYPVSCFSG